jgi:hypothetical protein
MGPHILQPNQRDEVRPRVLDNLMLYSEMMPNNPSIPFLADSQSDIFVPQNQI